MFSFFFLVGVIRTLFVWLNVMGKLLPVQSIRFQSVVCDQIHLSLFCSVIFLIRGSNSDIDAENMIVPHICTFSFNIFMLIQMNEI
jgi:hypothetical protein